MAIYIKETDLTELCSSSGSDLDECPPQSTECSEEVNAYLLDRNIEHHASTLVKNSQTTRSINGCVAAVWDFLWFISNSLLRP